MKKKGIILGTILLMGFIFTACGGKNEATSDEAAAAAVEQQATEAPETEEAAAEELPEAEETAPTEPEVPVAEEPEADTLGAVYESDLGYSIRYDGELYEYRSIEGYDEISLKSDDVELPPVFISISVIDAEYVDAVKAAMFEEYETSEAEGEPVMTKAGAEGFAVTRNDVWDGEETWDLVYKTYWFDMTEDKSIQLTTGWYIDDNAADYEASITEMVESLTF